MAAWIASNWPEQGRSWSFDLTAHCPLRLSTMNWLSATLVKPAEQPDQQDNGDRDPDQPEQKTFTHCVLLLPLAHINVRWELRFHGITRAESGEKQGLCERVACACVPGASPVGRSAATMFLFYCITRIERERGSRNVGSDRESCARLKMVARRRASSNQQPALGTTLHHIRYRIFRATHPGSFAAAYVIGIATDGLFDGRVPNGFARAGAGHPSIISPRLLLMRVPSWVIGEWVMGGKYSAEWWEKIAELKRGLPAQDPVSVVDHLIQATAHGARSPAKIGKPSGQNPAASKRERSLAD